MLLKRRSLPGIRSIAYLSLADSTVAAYKKFSNSRARAAFQCVSRIAFS